MSKKILITGLVFVPATLVLGIMESLVLMICRGARFESIWGESGWLQHLFAYSTIVPVMYLRGGTDPVFFLKIPLTVLVLALIVVSIWKRKFGLSLIAYVLGGLCWLFLVFLVTSVPLD